MVDYCNIVIFVMITITNIVTDAVNRIISIIMITITVTFANIAIIAILYL